MQRQTGRFERTVAGGEHVDAFVPFPLPPANPPFAVVRSGSAAPKRPSAA